METIYNKIIVNLPLAMSAPERIYVLKLLDNFTPNTIQPSPSESIDGTAAFMVPMSPYGFPGTTVVVQSDGIGGWWIINL